MFLQTLNEGKMLYIMKIKRGFNLLIITFILFTVFFLMMEIKNLASMSFLILFALYILFYGRQMWVILYLFSEVKQHYDLNNIEISIHFIDVLIKRNNKPSLLNLMFRHIQDNIKKHLESMMSELIDKNV